MEGRRDAGVMAARWRRTSGGGGDGAEESDGSSGDGGGVELSLRLRTGDSSGAPPVVAAAAEEERQAAAAAATRRRSMTIFYDGRVCAVDVTEVQVIHHHGPWHDLFLLCVSIPTHTGITHCIHLKNLHMLGS